MDIITALGVTYAAVGQEVTDAALQVIASDLSGYALEDVLASLSRCRKELRRISLADILDRLPNQHPGPEEAWAIVAPTLGNEDLSIVWTDPIRIASVVAWNLEDDPIAARMAFKEAYQRELAIARQDGKPPIWSLSPGRDVSSREATILYNVKIGRLPTSALMQLPAEIRDTAQLEEMDIKALSKAATTLPRKFVI